MVLHDSIKRNGSQMVNKDLIYFTDSRVLQFWYQNNCIKSEVAEKLIDIQDWCLEKNISMEEVWKPRESSIINTADMSCKSDTDDFSILNHIYRLLVKSFKVNLIYFQMTSNYIHKKSIKKRKDAFVSFKISRHYQSLFKSDEKIRQILEKNFK